MLGRSDYPIDFIMTCREPGGPILARVVPARALARVWASVAVRAVTAAVAGGTAAVTVAPLQPAWRASRPAP